MSQAVMRTARWRPPQPVGAVLFDLDGTLADTAPDLAAAVNRMRVRRGRDALPLELLRPVASHGARGLLRVGMDVGPEHPDFEGLKREFLDEYERALAVHTRLFDGASSLLDALERAGVAWGVVTNKVMRFAAPVLEGLGLAARAGVLVGGDTTPHPKPHPAPLLEACRRLQVPAHRAVYVGDDLRDVQAARAAGMPAIAARYGYLGDGEPIERWGADEIIDHLEELVTLLHIKPS
ncbi:phosphoglycolate phosphatase [Caldimonas aquatica]|uniref:Phosphoglycolate phosphatase n=1 Tax=Caldimonas aquatica TaxID=376175 RepID=A0ABY6MPU2_9BURK|nr:phosphoglycolate phosphatase [Schlegelella aquatica]UZD54141.1 phosphoglycolate phosphatase [Schlegelella aquatica]